VAGYTTYTFDLDISDVDRGVYDVRQVSVTQHPSEAPERLVCRVLAYALELHEGLAFAGDMATGDEPALWVRDLTGALLAWIEVGNPAPERLHRATKAAPRVAVYNHHPSERWLADVRAARVFAPDRLHIYDLPPRTVAELAGHLSRRNRWALSRNDGTVYLEAGAVSVEFGLGEAGV
jgi:uncharacterized protein YaeQ